MNLPLSEKVNYIRHHFLNLFFRKNIANCVGNELEMTYKPTQT